MDGLVESDLIEDEAEASEEKQRWWWNSFIANAKAKDEISFCIKSDKQQAAMQTYISKSWKYQ